MITLKGQVQTASELPIALDGARAYFQDVPAFFAKIEAVESVKPLSRPGAFLVTHHPMGGLNYVVRMVAVLECVWDEGGMRLCPLDFDLDQVRSDVPVVKGFVEGDLRLTARSATRTDATFGFSVTIDLPIPGVLKLVPRSLVQATGDGIMGLQTGLVVQNLFRKVMDDFQLTLEPVS